MSIATTALWLVDFGKQSFPIIAEASGVGWYFWLFSAGALLTIVLVAWLIPETKGRSWKITNFGPKRKVLADG